MAFLVFCYSMVRYLLNVLPIRAELIRNDFLKLTTLSPSLSSFYPGKAGEHRNIYFQMYETEIVSKILT